ncbi:hypothetical protein ACFY7Z_05960 [Streptomyces sp. NPDC012623]|uniref:hypothetical protein n=1 Tax=unclassified Streptomyces TaxID=2593676 RepID=UPI0036B777D2
MRVRPGVVFGAGEPSVVHVRHHEHVVPGAPEGRAERGQGREYAGDGQRGGSRARRNAARVAGTPAMTPGTPGMSTVSGAMVVNQPIAGAHRSSYRVCRGCGAGPSRPRRGRARRARRR